MGLPAQQLPALHAVSDPGLDETAKTLTPEQIAEVINRVIDKETAARFRVYLNTCVHCGLCSDACHWFLSNDRDPRFSPVGKVKQTLWEILKKKGQSGRVISSRSVRGLPRPNATSAEDAACIARSESTLPICCWWFDGFAVNWASCRNLCRTRSTATP